jgi:hypothetical protein
MVTYVYVPHILTTGPRRFVLCIVNDRRAVLRPSGSDIARFEIVPFRAVEAADRIPDHVGLAFELVCFHRQ